jgi:hypothetical protein
MPGKDDIWSTAASIHFELELMAAKLHAVVRNLFNKQKDFSKK